MLAKRIIPCLDIDKGRVVKGVNFVNLIDAGDPVEIARAYDKIGADEIVFLDITASSDGRKTALDVLSRASEQVFLPLTVGGGIRSVEDFRTLLAAGADKIAVNSAAILNPSLITEAALRFGSQCVVVAIDAKNVNGDWLVTTHGGSRFSEKELFSWARQAESLGAGEILFTSMDHDGTCGGYACSAYRELSGMLDIPVIASGGAGNASHIVEVLSPSGGNADAALAASIFHYGDVRIPDLKRRLAEAGIPVRI